MPFTTRGLVRFFFYVFRNADRPANYYLALLTSAVAPTHDTKDMSQVTQIATGNGYTDGGYALNLNATDFEAIIEDDVNQLAELHIKQVVWNATTGALPSSGNPAQYIVLTTGDATIANREILWYETFTSPQAILLGQTLTVSNMKLRLQGGGMIKSVQQVEIDITGSSRTGTATITAVDPDKSVVVFTGSSCITSADLDRVGNVSVVLTSATIVTAARSTTLTLSGTAVVLCQVVEYF